MSEDDEIVQAFLDESGENLDQLDRDLVALESRPSDPKLLAQIFRTIHTVKGTCGFLGFHRLEALTHAGESLLGALRAGDLVLDAPVTTSLLALVDAVRAMLREVETTGAEGSDDHGAVVADLLGHLSAVHPPDPTPSSPPAPPVPDAPDAQEAPSAGAESSVRVDVAVLDKLLDLVGELVLARGQIGNIASEDDEGPLAVPYRQLRLVTGELQDGVMRARLQPVGTVTGKFPRIARDLAATLGKKVRVEVQGEDVGVDKAVNEALRDPLLHLVRNAVDHGLESPADRADTGKRPEGLLRIRAYHEGGSIHVEVSDDGRGIDGDGLVERAVAAGELSVEDADSLTPAQRLELIFRPGLSIKQEVTSVSGRGVGMDAVRARLEQVGGTIEVSSRPGSGSVFRINVPLTSAIVPALVVWCGGGRYAVPLVDVQEVVHLEPGAPASTLDDVDGVRLYRLRGGLLPLVELAPRLGISSVRPDAGVDIVVARNGGRQFGLVVDGVGDTIEAVIKPLSRAVRSVPVFTGVTILGDGTLSLVLDVAALAAGVALETRTDDRKIGSAGPGGSSPLELLLATGANGSLAFRLPEVRRLEQFRADRVERVGHNEVVQYGDAVVPLIRITSAGAAAEVLDVVVCASSAGPIALVVDRIDDVVAEPVTSLPATGPSGAPCLVVSGRVTELVDVEALVAAAGVARTA